MNFGKGAVKLNLGIQHEYEKKQQESVMSSTSKGGGSAIASERTKANGERDVATQERKRRPQILSSEEEFGQPTCGLSGSHHAKSHSTSHGQP